MRLSPKQAAEAMSRYYFNQRYRAIVKSLESDAVFDSDKCRYCTSTGYRITPDGERGLVRFIERETE